MPKLLCLPGYLQNGAVLAEKSSGLRKALTKKLGYQMDYMDPPFVIPNKELLPFPLAADADEASERWQGIVDKNFNRCWWLANNPGEHEGFEQSLNHVVDYIRTNGPYDGVVGFSQGAAMAAIVANSIEWLLPEHGPFKVAAYFSGFAFTKPVSAEELLNDVIENNSGLADYASRVCIYEQYRQYYAVPAGFPTRVLAVYGADDAVVPPIRSMYLNLLYPDGIVHAFEHDGGHYVPNKKQFLAPLVEQFKEVLGAKL